MVLGQLRDAIVPKQIGTGIANVCKRYVLFPKSDAVSVVPMPVNALSRWASANISAVAAGPQTLGFAQPARNALPKLVGGIQGAFCVGFARETGRVFCGLFGQAAF